MWVRNRVIITGDPARADALGRHLTAELSLNPWSTLVEVDTFGIGGELAHIDPTRHRHHAGDDVDLLDRLVSGLEAEDPALEPDQLPRWEPTLLRSTGWSKS